MFCCPLSVTTHHTARTHSLITPHAPHSTRAWSELYYSVNKHLCSSPVTMATLPRRTEETLRVSIPRQARGPTAWQQPGPHGRGTHSVPHHNTTPPPRRGGDLTSHHNSKTYRHTETLADASHSCIARRLHILVRITIYALGVTSSQRASSVAAESAWPASQGPGALRSRRPVV